MECMKYVNYVTKKKACAWICAPRTTNRYPESVITEEKEKSVIFAISCGQNVLGINSL